MELNLNFPIYLLACSIRSRRDYFAFCYQYLALSISLFIINQYIDPAAQSVTRLGYGMTGPGFESLSEQDVFSFANTSTSSLAPIQPVLQRLI